MQVIAKNYHYFFQIKPLINVSLAVTDSYSVLTEKRYCLGKKFPLNILHDTLLENLRCIIGEYINSTLEYDSARISLLVDEMDSCAAYLHTVVKGSLMDFQPVKALAAE